MASSSLLLYYIHNCTPRTVSSFIWYINLEYYNRPLPPCCTKGKCREININTYMHKYSIRTYTNLDGPLVWSRQQQQSLMILFVFLNYCDAVIKFDDPLYKLSSSNIVESTSPRTNLLLWTLSFWSFSDNDGSALSTGFSSGNLFSKKLLSDESECKSLDGSATGKVQIKDDTNGSGAAAGGLDT